MILVDTSVWIDHFRRGNAELVLALDSGRCLMHEAVLGELVCGSLPRRTTTIPALRSLRLPSPVQVKQTVLELLDRLPDTCSLEDVLYHLSVLQSVERGLDDVDAARTSPHEVVEREMREKWFGNHGR